MPFYTDLFSPTTFEAFARSDRTISGFRATQRAMADRVKPGDMLVCYLTKLSRWVGVLKVESEAFESDAPIFYPQGDPFVIRFRVTPIVWLDLEHTVPIKTPELWQRLSFTRSHAVDEGGWIGPLRRSLQTLHEEDGRFLCEHLSQQATLRRVFPVDVERFEALRGELVQRPDGAVPVTVPVDDEPLDQDTAPPALRESFSIQAKLAGLGERMGFSIWLPKADRTAVLQEWKPSPGVLVDRLPLHYDGNTQKTIEQIDVLWLKKSSIRRAFEVEHTTAVFSGLLRMADLLALQPDVVIPFHIVAPEGRREKVFAEILRPVFSLLERAPLANRCTYLSYGSVRALLQLPHIEHFNDSVLDEYVEEAEA